MAKRSMMLTGLDRRPTRRVTPSEVALTVLGFVVGIAAIYAFLGWIAMSLFSGLHDRGVGVEPYGYVTSLWILVSLSFFGMFARGFGKPTFTVKRDK